MPKTPSRPQPAAEAPLEATNPAGPPDGTDHGHTGTLDTSTTPTAPPGAVQPSAADLGSTAPTQGDTEEQAHGTPAGTPEGTGDPVQALALYLRTHYPQEWQEGDEHPATLAQRLLQRLAAKGTSTSRCDAPYCNLPLMHHGEHGWVHVEPATAR